MEKDISSKPIFPITANNEELLDAFKEKGWIYEYLEDAIGMASIKLGGGPSVSLPQRQS